MGLELDTVQLLRTMQTAHSEMVRPDFQIDRVLSLLLREALSSLNLSRGQLLIVEGDRLIIKATTGDDNPARTLNVDDCVCGIAVTLGRAVNIPDVSLEPKYKSFLGAMQSELAVPLVVHHQVIGVLNVESPQLAAFQDEHVAFLTLFAEQAALALKVASLYDERRSAAHLQESLLTSLKGLEESTTETTALYQGMIQTAMELLDASFAQFLLVQGDTLVIVATTGPEPLETKLSVHDCICGQAVLTRSAINIPDVSGHPLYRRFLGEMKSELAVPLVDGHQVIGVLNVESPAANAFAARHEQALSALAFYASTTIRNAQTHDSLRAGVHRIRGIITPIRNRASEFVNVLQDPTHREWAGTIVRNAEAIREIVVRVLTPRPNLLPLMAEDILSYALSKVDLPSTMTVDVPLNTVRVPLVYGDLPQLEDVFVFLIENAAHATEHAVQPTLTVSIEFVAPVVHVRIRDNGIGIPADKRARIFEPFFTTKDAGKAKGSGLGLYFCHNALRRMGGAIDCIWTEEGKGAEFQVTLQSAVGTIVVGRTADIEPIPRSRHILIIDDDDPWRLFAAETLRNAGHVIETWAPRIDGPGQGGIGKGLLEVVDRSDLLLVDLSREGKDGVKFLARLKAHIDQARELRRLERGAPEIAALAPASSRQALVDMAKLGVFVYSAKPYTPDDLLRVVTNSLTAPFDGSLDRLEDRELNRILSW